MCLGRTLFDYDLRSNINVIVYFSAVDSLNQPIVDRHNVCTLIYAQTLIMLVLDSRF
jgi:hypothetical protein